MKLRNARGRTDSNSGYNRVFGSNELGALCSKVQATVISNGSELERMIITRTKNVITDLTGFISKATTGEVPDGVFLCTKAILKRSIYAISGIEPDLLVFIIEKKRICKIIELKDGDSFDTKKSQGEQEHLQEFALKFGSKIPFVADYFICCFNQNDKQIIFDGLKGRFTMEHIMTGKEFCQILNIDYDEIVQKRQQDTADNLNYFVEELLKIKNVKATIIKQLGVSK